MDVVYVVGKDSKWSNNELRYSLRSLEKYVSDIDHVFIVGELPTFITGVIHLPAIDPFKWNKEGNIHSKLLIAAQCQFVSNKFLFMNDDHFFLRNISTVPYAHLGPLSMNGVESPVYAQYLENTRKALLHAGLPIKNFDIHLPMIIDKRRFVKMSESFNWFTDEIENTLVVKSLYANYCRIPGSREVDCKIKSTHTSKQISLLMDRRWAFSTAAEINPGTRAMISHLYPIRSQYEDKP